MNPEPPLAASDQSAALTPLPPPIIAVVGATASGKSELALQLAQRLGGEIINTDAMQIYRGMDVGTAKVGAEAQARVVHHLLDQLNVAQTASVAQFQQWALQLIAHCRSRVVAPVLVGGSALYTRAIIDEFEFPGTDPVLRARLNDELAQFGSEVLHQRLQQLDPAAAAQILPTNARRIVRALEVITLTGSFQAELPAHVYRDPQTVQIGVDLDRAALDVRIEARVEQMWQAGFVAEVEALIAQGLREGVTANRAIGYRQILQYLDGQITEEEAKRRTVVATRRFARRQDSWFRKDPRIVWVHADDPQRLQLALSAIDQLGNKQR